MTNSKISLTRVFGLQIFERGNNGRFCSTMIVQFDLLNQRIDPVFQRPSAQQTTNKVASDLRRQRAFRRQNHTPVRLYLHNHSECIKCRLRGRSRWQLAVSRKKRCIDESHDVPPSQNVLYNESMSDRLGIGHEVCRFDGETTSRSWEC